MRKGGSPFSPRRHIRRRLFYIKSVYQKYGQKSRKTLKMVKEREDSENELTMAYVPFRKRQLPFCLLAADEAAACAIKKGGYVCTPNALMLERAYRDTDFLSVLSNSSFLVVDGVGAALYLRALGIKAKRLTGVTLGEAVSSLCAKRGLSLFLYGGRAGVALRAARALQTRYPGLKIAGAMDGYGEREKALQRIVNSSADVVFVCLGSPRQEYFMQEIKETSSKRKMTAFGLGGSLDVYAEEIRRAPIIFQRLGMEFFYRMICQPHRLRQIPHLCIFVFILGKEWLKRTKRRLLHA